MRCRPVLLAVLPCLLPGCGHAADGEVKNPGSMEAFRDPSSGQLVLTEAGRPVLRYNYWTVEPGVVLEQVTEPNLSRVAVERLTDECKAKKRSEIT